MGFYVWSGLVSFVANLAIGLFVYSRKTSAPANRWFFLLCLAISGWSVGSFLENVIPDLALALNILRINYLFAVWLPFVFIRYIQILIDGLSRISRVGKCSLIFSAILTPIVFVPAFIPSIRLIGDSQFRISQPGSLYTLFFIYFVASMTYVMWLNLWSIRAAERERQKQLSWAAVANAIAVFAGFEYFSRVFDFIKHPPLDDYILVLYLLILAYAMIKHRLMDIRIVIRKTLIYSAFAFALSIIYLLFVFLMHDILLKHKKVSISFWLGFLSILVIAVSLKPFEVLCQRLLEKFFFKGTIQEISHQNEQLEDELERAERLKSLGILAAGMAHEIKNPIAAIKTFSEYLPQKKNDPEFMEKFSHILAGETARIERIVRDLLLFSKPSVPQKRACSIETILKNVLDLMTSEFLKGRIETVRDFDGAGDVEVDPHQITQAVLNIVMNALESMKGKGGGRLELVARREGVWVKIEVRDAGLGIAPEKISHIFDPFFTDKNGGTGLGLAITHSLVQKNSGCIEVESNLGSGTVFRVTLPAA